jgi:hypothetical protein
VALRKVPGALALGLLASLAAHAALYGGEHAMGGAYNVLLLQGALAAATGLVVFFASLAWSESSGIADGSVLAARLRERLPGLGLLLPAAAFWYAAAEGVEPHHADTSTGAIALALVAAAWLIERLARGILGLLAGAAIAVLRDSFSPRTPSWKRRPRLRPVLRRTFWTHRRFARPPPIAA